MPACLPGQGGVVAEKGDQANLLLGARILAVGAAGIESRVASFGGKTGMRYANDA